MLKLFLIVFFIIDVSYCKNDVDPEQALKYSSDKNRKELEIKKIINFILNKNDFKNHLIQRYDMDKDKKNKEIFKNYFKNKFQNYLNGTDEGYLYKSNPIKRDTHKIKSEIGKNRNEKKNQRHRFGENFDYGTILYIGKREDTDYLF